MYNRRYRRIRRIPIRRRVGYRPRTRFRKNPYVYRLGNRVKALEKGVELKRFQVSLGSPTAINDYLGTCLNDLAKDTSQSGRIGEKFTIKSITVQACISTTEVTDVFGHYIIFIMRHPRSITLETSGNLDQFMNISTDHVGNCVDWHERSQFWVLASKSFCINGATGNPRSKQWIKYYKKFKTGLEVVFDPIGVNPENIEKNAVYVAFILDEITNTSVSGIGRISFVDS